MRIHILLIPVLICLLCCSGGSIDNDTKKTKETDLKYRTPMGQAVRVITVDSCEYIIIHGSNSVAIIHKQNCKNH